MKRLATTCLLGLAALALGPAGVSAQQPPKDLFKDKVKPGMYEDKVEIDMTGTPGIPAGQGKQTQTVQRCLTQEEFAKGPAPDQPGCVTSNFKMAGESATFTTVCKQGSETQTVELRLTPTSKGFATEARTTTSQGGQVYKSTIKSESRYLGPCK
jgi:hypothetical protein